jgi:long-chain acyl-CoA synthetase
MPHLGDPLEQPVPLSDLLATGLARSPDEPALLSLEGNASWSELDRMATALAASYLALGLEPGDRFASLMPNRIALIAHYLACFKAGLVATPLNFRYTAPEIDHALEVSQARAILAHAERLGDLAATKAGTLPLGVITYGAGDPAVRASRASQRSRATGWCFPTWRPRHRPRSSSPPAAPVRPRG